MQIFSLSEKTQKCLKCWVFIHVSTPRFSSQGLVAKKCHKCFFWRVVDSFRISLSAFKKSKLGPNTPTGMPKEAIKSPLWYAGWQENGLRGPSYSSDVENFVRFWFGQKFGKKYKRSYFVVVTKNSTTTRPLIWHEYWIFLRLLSTTRVKNN